MLLNGLRDVLKTGWAPPTGTRLQVGGAHCWSLSGVDEEAGPKGTEPAGAETGLSWLLQWAGGASGVMSPIS